MADATGAHSPWDREAFRAWDAGTKSVWLHLLTGPRRNRLGCLVADGTPPGEDAPLPREDAEAALERIEAEGRILRDADAGLLLIRRYLAYRPLDGGDRRPAALLADSLPSSGPVLGTLRRELAAHGGKPGRLAERVLADRLEGAGNEAFPWRRRRRVPELMRRRVRRRDGGRCARCGGEEELTVDHVRPFSRGGLTVPRNLQLLCRSCNASKSAHTMEEWVEGS